MSKEEIFADIADERLQLADLFESLSVHELNTPSLCQGWSVKDVAGHVTTVFNVSLPAMAWRTISEPMSFSGAVDRLTKEMSRRPIEGIVAQLRDKAHDRRHPPGAPIAPLTDLLVHGEDVRRPLGIRRDVPYRRVAASMQFVTGGRAFGFLPASRVRGLRFVATDSDDSWGHGDVIHGPAMSLLLGAMGRYAAFDDLGGAVHTLRDRVDGKRRHKDPPRV